jgi:CHAT domain-containing protein
MQQRIYERCRKLGKLGETGLPPFDVGRAYRLYKTFFGSAEKAIAGKHLIIVPSASLMQLPFAALVTYLPQQGSILPRDLKWLGTTFPVSVLPSVSSLSALRRVAKPSKATKPFLGVGNPLLTGGASSGEHRQLAAEARAKQKCAGPVRVAAGGTRAVLSVAHLLPANAFQGSLADVATLKAQVPLPETADELCGVAQSLQVGPEDVLLGDRATETVLKDMGNGGRLEQYRILHFATHGLVSGDLPGVAEPSVMLTPPGAATEQDDGLLTASEIAQLKLDANWVVLSACNTAAGGSEGAEALSGLARAFFYAGARSVLVTHWEINSAAAVKLTTGAFSALQRQPGLSQAEAMRQAMAALVRDDTVPDAAHPAVWAAFALVGDGWRQ